MKEVIDARSSPAFCSQLPRATARTTLSTPMRRQTPISSSPWLARRTTSKPEPSHLRTPARRKLTLPRRPSLHLPRHPIPAGLLEPRRSPTSRPLSRASALAIGAPLMAGVVPRLSPRGLRVATSGLARRSAAPLRPSDPGSEVGFDDFGLERRVVLSSCFVTLRNLVHQGKHLSKTKKRRKALRGPLASSWEPLNTIQDVAQDGTGST